MLLPDRGIAVLRYDRRAWSPGRDVPYALQAEDLSMASEPSPAKLARSRWGCGGSARAPGWPS